MFLDPVSSVINFGAACVHVGERRVWAAEHMRRLYMLLISLCYVWAPLDHRGWGEGRNKFLKNAYLFLLVFDELTRREKETHSK